MNTKLKTCVGCGQEKVIWKRIDGARYCKDCAYSINKPKAIKVTSYKMKPLHQLYSVMRKEFLEQPGNDVCNAQLPGCTFSTHLTIHHKKGRGKYYLDNTTWVTLCMNCHMYVETHPQEAVELGFTETRLKREDS